MRNNKRIRPKKDCRGWNCCWCDISYNHTSNAWALILQQLFNVLVDTVVLWLTVKWRPRLQFSFIRLKRLFSFGWKLLASSLIDTVYTQLRQLVIGKIYSSSDLAYYNRGQQFPLFWVGNINAAIDSVLFPTMSMEQDDKKRVKGMTRRAIKTSNYFISPVMIELALISEQLVRLLLTNKWMPAIPFLRIFCIAYIFSLFTLLI